MNFNRPAIILVPRGTERGYTTGRKCMTDAFLRQIALISESNQIDPGNLTAVSAALQKQVTRDLVQFWNVKATVDAFPQLEDVPIGYWPIIIKDNIGFNV